VHIRTRRSADRTDPGHELAGGVTYSVLVSTDGGRSYQRLRRRARPFRVTLRLRGGQRHLVVGLACDANNNCGVRRLGPYR
jgi:hypothetical protein